jgi:DNA replication protein
VINNIIFDNYPLIDVTDSEFLLWLQLYREQQAGSFLPDFEKIATRMKIEKNVVIHRLNTMHKKGLLKLERKGNQEYLDLTPFIKRIQEEVSINPENDDHTSLIDLKQAFEESFGRLLGSYELEELQKWVNEDHYHPEVIKLALKETVLNNARSFKYTAAVLLNWYQNNLTTKEAVISEQKKRETLKRQKDAENEFKAGR